MPRKSPAAVRSKCCIELAPVELKTF
jgi:hypothetical protein